MCALVDQLLRRYDGLSLVGLGVAIDRRKFTAEQPAFGIDVLDGELDTELGRQVIGRHEARAGLRNADDERVFSACLRSGAQDQQCAYGSEHHVSMKPHRETSLSFCFSWAIPERSEAFGRGRKNAT